MEGRRRRRAVLAGIAVVVLLTVAGWVTAISVAHPGLALWGSGDTENPTPPGAPIQEAITPTTVTVSWPPADDNVGVAFYDVYKDGQLVISVPGAEISGTADGLSPNQPYGIYIIARDAAGNVSQASPTVIVRTPGSNDTVAPTAPANLRAAAVGGNCVSLTWEAATDNVAVVSYNIYRDGTTRVGSSSIVETRVCGLTRATAYRPHRRRGRWKPERGQPRAIG